MFFVNEDLSIIIITIFTLCEFSIPVLTGGFSLKSEWQQVSSGLQESSLYSGQSYLYYGLNSSSDFLIPSLFSKLLQTIPSTPTTYCITITLFHRFFCSRPNYLSLFSCSFISLSNLLELQNLLDDKFFSC